MKGAQMSYVRFLSMIAVSTVVMFGLMYLNTYALDHVFYSQTRTWMALLMGAVMAIVMMGFMWAMYRDKRLNAAIIAGSVIVFATALWLVRSQGTASHHLHEGDDPASFDRGVDQQAGAHTRPARARGQNIDAQVREIIPAHQKIDSCCVSEIPQEFGP
jgi:drug/metabolite transporter (DMT)-like permease